MKESKSLFNIQNKRILLLSPQNWNQTFVSKHHYAKELSKNNHVWFLNSAGKKWFWKFISINQISEKFFVIDYLYLFYGLNKLPNILVSIINYLISKVIKLRIGKIDIVWSFEQTRFFNLKLFNADYTIFHPVDYIPGYPNLEKRIADSSDIIISVSKPILNNIDSSRPKFLVNHGLFIPKKNLGPPIKFDINLQRINVAYVGTLNHGHIDRKNFLNIIKMNLHCDFHIIGPVNETVTDNLNNLNYTSFFDQLSALSNIHFHGVLKSEVLLSVLNYFDILFCCYDWINNPIRISNSHKILEYLYTGKVTVTNFFDAYKAVPEEILIMLESNEIIPAKILEISKHLDHYNSNEKIEKRKRFALKYTYEKNINRIEKILNSNLLSDI